VAIRTSSVSFPPLRGGGPRAAQSTVVFPRTVLRAVAGLTNYSVGFSGDDHNIGNLQIQLDTTVDADAVTVNVSFGLRDWSGDWDDNYQGDVEFAVIADLAPATATPPRSDVVIADAEFNQATQFFESLRHLDSEHALPDNSIRLIGGKNLGIRLYVDYDAADTTAPIAFLSGEMRLTASSGATTTLAPLSTVVPRPQTAIDRGNVGHTLNFMVPGIWCEGQLAMEVEVFDSASPASRSARFGRTLRFLDVVPLQIHGVAIHYTGQGLDLQAPTIAEFIASMDFTERVYPVGEVVLAGYQAQDYARDLKPSDDGDDTPGYDGILDMLLDLRGGGDEVFLALLPTGGIDVQIDTTGWSIDGIECSGVGVSFAGDESAIAHEVGHAFGRDHAPCDSSGRCDDPESTDDSYPKYGTYPSDSIGEFGFDPIANAVRDPASTFDFMGYSNSTWTSPYTYTALMGALPPTGGGPSLSSTSRQMVRRRGEAKQGMGLFLRLTIGPDDHVELEPSFTHEAAAVPLAGRSDWHVEQRDAQGEVLSCIALNVPRSCRCRRSRRVRQLISRSVDAERLAVVHDGEDVLVEPFGAPPEVTATAKAAGDNIDVQWNGDDDIWVIVQGLDRAGTWRGLAPRTQAPQIALPTSALQKRGFSKLRLLAVRGLTTAVVDLRFATPGVVASSTIVTRLVAPRLLKAWVVADDGPDFATVVWSNEHGAQLGRGHTLDLRDHPDIAIVRVTAIGSARLIEPRVIVLDRVEGQLCIAEDRPVGTSRAVEPSKPARRPRRR
jgi:hypothetical protein